MTSHFPTPVVHPSGSSTSPGGRRSFFHSKTPRHSPLALRSVRSADLSVQCNGRSDQYCRNTGTEAAHNISRSVMLQWQMSDLREKLTSPAPGFSLPLRSGSASCSGDRAVPWKPEESSKKPHRATLGDAHPSSLEICNLSVKRITARKVAEDGEDDLFKVRFESFQAPSSSIRQNTDGAAVITMNGRDRKLRSHIIDLDSDQASVTMKSVWLTRSDLTHAREQMKAFGKRPRQQRKKQVAPALNRLPQQTPPGDAFVPERHAAYNTWLRERVEGHAGITSDMILILSVADVRDLAFSNTFI